MLALCLLPGSVWGQDDVLYLLTEDHSLYKNPVAENPISFSNIASAQALKLERMEYNGTSFYGTSLPLAFYRLIDGFSKKVKYRFRSYDDDDGGAKHCIELKIRNGNISSKVKQHLYSNDAK